MGIHYDYKSTRGEKAMKKEAKRKARLEERRARKGVDSQKIKAEKFTRAYVLINEKKEILVRTRSSKGMLASMLEVPNDVWVKNKKLLICQPIAAVGVNSTVG